eukprot:2805053-Pleurochrysis_carterae.AAC.3
MGHWCVPHLLQSSSSRQAMQEQVRKRLETNLSLALKSALMCTVQGVCIQSATSDTNVAALREAAFTLGCSLTQHVDSVALRPVRQDALISRRGDLTARRRGVAAPKPSTDGTARGRAATLMR